MRIDGEYSEMGGRKKTVGPNRHPRHRSGEGVKLDEGKLRYDLVPQYPLEQLAKLYTEGAKKYDDENWRKGMEWNRIYAAIQRHLAEWRKGVSLDPETGVPHVIAAAWGCFALAEYERTGAGKDNRVDKQLP